MQTTALNLQSSAPAAASGLRTTLYLGVMMLFVCALSLFFFNSQSLRLDEAQSLWQSGRSAGDILTIVAQDVHVPLYHELLHFWRLLVSDSVEAARGLSLVFYVLLLPAAYFLGKRAYGRESGLFAAGLLAISPFLNWYGSVIRMYTLFTLLVVVNQYFFLKLWKGPTDKTWVSYILSALLGIFTHYFFLLTLLGQAIFFVVRRDIFPPGSLRRFIFSWGFLMLAFTPWLVFVALQSQAANASPMLSVPTTINLFSAFAQFLFGFQDDHLSTIFLSLWPMTILFAFLALRKTTRMEPETQYFLLSVLISIAVAFAVSLLLAPVFASRYLIFTVPSLFLLIASLISVYPPRAASIARVGLMLVLGAMLAVEIANPATPVKENYREAANYLNENATAQDIVVLSAPFTVYPVEYYYRGAAPLATLPMWERYNYGPIPAFDEQKLPSEVTTLTKDHEYAWILFSYNQGYEQTIRQYMDNHFKRVALRTFSPGLELAVYKIRYDSSVLRLTPPLTLGQ